MHFLLREDLRNLDKYTQEIKLLHTYHLDTDVQLSAFQGKKQQQLEALIRQRQKLRNQLRRCSNEDSAAAIKAEISGLSAEIAAARREVRLCSDIQQRSIQMAENLKIIRRDEQHRREELEHGHQRTSR